MTCEDGVDAHTHALVSRFDLLTDKHTRHTTYDTHTYDTRHDTHRYDTRRTIHDTRHTHITSHISHHVRHHDGTGTATYRE